MFKIKKSAVRRVDSIPFDSKNKYAGVKIDNKYKINLVKGAPEKLLDYCKYYVDEFGERKEFKNKDKVKEKIESLTSKGIRVLVLITNNNLDLKNFRNSSLVGVVCLKDEIRKEAVSGIKLMKDASIQTVMITGDNKKNCD